MREQDIEQQLLHKLSELKYTLRPEIRDRATLEQNFRAKFEELNKVKLTDGEFARLLADIVSPDVFASAKVLREQQSFEREDGTPLVYMLVNTKDWCKNSFEVVNQLRINTDNSHHRYDVMLLLNGVPVVQIELKTLSITPRRAIQQIVDYKNDSGNGYGKTLLCFVQLFVVSNHSETWYFANNNNKHFSFDAEERFLPMYQFAGRDNKKITHLSDFAEKFLAKCTLSEMISRYMVLIASEQKMMIMRPYQIYAVKGIVECIEQNCGNGYIWHTTGSGKTLTSFKASTLLKDNPSIEKCLFVVDRKDLDRQTRDEFNKFQENCVEENTNTESLVRRLLSNDYADKVIVTTIQKLGLALDDSNTRNYKQRLEPLKNKRVVFIFDECHRSQFGENHQAIREFFPNAQLFGFTGTPIFEINSTQKKITDNYASHITTKDIFTRELHAYTITHAIEDQNVLRFRVDYYKPEGTTLAKPGEPLAKQAVIEAILSKHDTATAGRKFNALLATASINDAIEYHRLFAEVQARKRSEDPEFKPLNIACVFSPPAEGNKDVRQLQEDLLQEKHDNQTNPEEKKAALQRIMDGYNAQYGTNYNLNDFDLYYKDVQSRIKDQQYANKDLPHSKKIDITIVVDMMLTGFDSKYLNTLYVDKNLKHHGLIQAFSRTNRVLNDTKPYGNILDFRQQKDAVEAAIMMFSDQDKEKAKDIWLVESAGAVIEKYQHAVRKLASFMDSVDLQCQPEDVPKLQGDAARSMFIERFKEIQRLHTQLDQYTDLTPENKATIQGILPPDTLQGFKGVYLETAQRLKEKQDRPDTTTEVQVLDFEFVLFASAVIDYDYIMNLLARYSGNAPSRHTVTKEQLLNLIRSDAKFMGEGEDLIEYIDTLQVGSGLSEQDIKAGYETFKAQNNARKMAEVAHKHSLNTEAMHAFVADTLRRMVLDDDVLSELIAPLGLGWKDRTKKRREVVADLKPLLKKLAGERDISGLRAYEQ